MLDRPRNPPRSEPPALPVLHQPPAEKGLWARRRVFDVVSIVRAAHVLGSMVEQDSRRGRSYLSDEGDAARLETSKVVDAYIPLDLGLQAKSGLLSGGEVQGAGPSCRVAVLSPSSHVSVDDGHVQVLLGF